jgi:hypothetical protein
MIDDVRLAPKITTALEIAVLVKCLPDIQQAADLIEQYANTVAAGAKIEAAQEAYERTLRVMNAPLGEELK